MKKKIYFIISAVLQIIASIYFLINAEAINQLQIEQAAETYAGFPVEYQEKVISMMENSGSLIIIISAILGILLNAIVLKTSISNTILRNKGKLIAISIATLFTSTGTLDSKRITSSSK